MIPKKTKKTKAQRRAPARRRRRSVNRFATDTDAELEAVRAAALAGGAEDAVVCTHHGEGGRGAAALARAVAAVCERLRDAGTFRRAGPSALRTPRRALRSPSACS